MTMMNKFVISLLFTAVVSLIILWVAADQELIHTRWNYDDSEYHYIMQETRSLDLRIGAYEHDIKMQLAEHEAFARKMIDFYHQHKENLQYDKRERERH
jgi:hypothetical protein